MLIISPNNLGYLTISIVLLLALGSFGSVEPTAQEINGDRISELGSTDDKQYIDKTELFSLLMKYHSNQTKPALENGEKQSSTEQLNMTPAFAESKVKTKPAATVLRRIKLKQDQEYQLVSK